MNKRDFVRRLGIASNPEKIKQLFIDDEPTQYFISSYGYIAALNYAGKQEIKILSQGVNGSGYLYSTISYKGNVYALRIHRMVAEAFIDNPKNLPQVNHKDGNKEHNQESNLEWLSASENTKHAYDIGLCTILTGEDNPHCKISNETVIQICTFLQEGKLSIPEIAKCTGAPESTIKNIVYHRAHKGVSVKYSFGEFFNRYGKENPYRKYTDDQIHTVCQELERNKLTMRQIAEKTDVPYDMVKQIRSGKCRQKIASQYDFSGYTRLVS